MNKTFVAAPVLFIAYGIARLIDGIDGAHGPGPAWTIGHLFFLTGIVLYTVTLVRLGGLIAGGAGASGGSAGAARSSSHFLRSRIAEVALVAGLVGLVAMARVVVIDLIVGFRAADRPEMSRLGSEYDRWPGDLGIYGVSEALGPALLMAGLLTLAILLTVTRRLPVWSPVLLLAGFVLISVNLDLLPLGGLALLVGQAPLLVDRLAPARMTTVGG